MEPIIFFSLLIAGILAVVCLAIWAKQHPKRHESREESDVEAEWRRAIK